MSRPVGFRQAVIGLFAAALVLSSAAPSFAGPEDQLRSTLLRADNVVATGISPTNIFVTWTDRSLLETHYRIEMAFDEEGPYETVATRGPCEFHDRFCYHVITTGPPHDPTPRFLRVTPYINVGGIVTILEGPPSEPDPAILGPRAPTNLKCNGGPVCLGVSTITLTWTDNSDESLFWIMRAKGTSQPPNFGTEPHATVPANVTTYTESNLDLATTFFYKVVAVREVSIVRSDGKLHIERGFADCVDPERIRIETPPVAPPIDPSGLNVVFVPPSTARLTWTDNSTNEDGFYIEWGPTSTQFLFQTSILANTGVGTVTFLQPDVPPDVQRCYRVRAYRAAVPEPSYSKHTNVACVESTPRAPSGLTATAISNTTVNLAWNDLSTSEEKFEIERCPGSCSQTSSAWVEIDEVPADTTTYTDFTTVGSTNYSYRVFAANSTGRSAASNIATVLTLPTPLAPPSDFDATGIGSREIRLRWKDNTPDETGFIIEFLNPGGEWQRLTNVAASTGIGSTVEFVDTTSLSPLTTRCYRVRAFKGTAMSDPSNEDCGTTLGSTPPSGAPSGLTGTPVSNTRIDLQWTDNASNENGFNVDYIVFANKRCTDAGIPTTPTGLTWRRFATAPSHPSTGTTTFAAQALIPHTAYFFRVSAFNHDGETLPAESACITTLGPPAPIFVSPEASGDFEVTRCEVTIRAPYSQVSKLRVYVVSNLPGVGPYDTERFDGPNTSVGPSPTSGDLWVLKYKFRKGITYGLIATSFGPEPTSYQSADTRLRDITVAADCPIDPDPFDPEP